MTDIQALQQSYNTLYSALRNYIWPMTTIEIIADLELEIYKAFPNLKTLDILCNKLFQSITDVISEDEELKAAYTELHRLVMSSSDTYVVMNKVNEVITDENI